MATGRFAVSVNVAELDNEIRTDGVNELHFGEVQDEELTSWAPAFGEPHSDQRGENGKRN